MHKRTCYTHAHTKHTHSHTHTEYGKHHSEQMEHTVSHEQRYNINLENNTTPTTRAFCARITLHVHASHKHNTKSRVPSLAPTAAVIQFLDEFAGPAKRCTGNTTIHARETSAHAHHTTTTPPPPPHFNNGSSNSRKYENNNIHNTMRTNYTNAHTRE